MPKTGGPARDFKFADLQFYPDDESPAEWEKGGTDWENKRTSNGRVFRTGKDKAGMFKQNCVMTNEEYDLFMDKKNSGDDFSGNATLVDGTVLRLNCGVEGEHQLVDGKVEITLMGIVKPQ